MRMKNLGLMIIVGFFGFILAAQAANPKVRLVTTTWAPYVFNNSSYHGYAYEIVTAAFAAAGYQVDIQFKPWKQALADVKTGKADAIFPEYISPERQKNLEFSQPFSGGPIVLYKSRDTKFDVPVELIKSNQPALFNQMKDYKFGIVYGYSNTPAFDSNNNLIKRYVINDLENLKQLYRGKVDFIVIDKFTAEYLIHQTLGKQYAKLLAPIYPPLGFKKFYLAVANNNSTQKKLLQVFNRGLAKIKRNGGLAAILDRDVKYTGDLVA